MTKEEQLDLLRKCGIQVNGDLVLEKHVENEIGNVEDGGIGIQIIYNDKKPKSTAPKTKNAKPTSDKPQTLRYFKHGNKGLIAKQQKRVLLVFTLLNKWHWIDIATRAEDFDSFFEGEPRHCNIKWTANSTIVTILMQELLKQNYIEKQKGCSPTSLVKNQFEMTPNFDKSRLDASSEERIGIILYILDLQNPLVDRQDRDNMEEADMQETAIKAILAEQLRTTKGI